MGGAAVERSVSYRYVIFDHDSKFNVEVIQLLTATGLQPKRTSVQAPWQNGVAERWVGSCRREVSSSTRNVSNPQVASHPNLASTRLFAITPRPQAWSAALYATSRFEIGANKCAVGPLGEHDLITHRLRFRFELVTGLARDNATLSRLNRGECGKSAAFEVRQLAGA
jgi:hypothetical protein